jgi:hypothetical protein
VLRSAAIAATVLSVVAAGCGGGGGGGRLSKADYATQADAICSKYNRKIQALGAPKSLADIGGFADKALKVTRQGNAELSSLKPPKNEDQTAKEWIAQNELVAKAVADLRDAAKQNDKAAIQAALKRGQRANKSANGLARDLGLRVCAKG